MERQERIKLLVVTGATASGKTRLAVKLAEIFDGEIISADSRQVYRGMDIGTGKDLDEYEIDGLTIPYHLIDIRQAGEKYSVSDFQSDLRYILAAKKYGLTNSIYELKSNK